MDWGGSGSDPDMDFFSRPPDGFGVESSVPSGHTADAADAQNLAPDDENFDGGGWEEGKFSGGFPISEDDEALASAFSIDLQTIWASPSKNSAGGSEGGEEDLFENVDNGNDGDGLHMFQTPLQVTPGSVEAPDSRFSWRSEKGNSQDGGWLTFGIEPNSPITPQLMTPLSTPFALDRAPDSAPPAPYHPTSSPLAKNPTRLGERSPMAPSSDANFAHSAASRFEACPTLTTILPASSPPVALEGAEFPPSRDPVSSLLASACFRNAFVAGTGSSPPASLNEMPHSARSPAGSGALSGKAGGVDSARAFPSFDVPDRRPARTDSSGGLKNSTSSSKEEGAQSVMDSLASDTSTGTFVALPGAESGKGWEGPVFGMSSLSERGDGSSDEDRQLDEERQPDGDALVDGDGHADGDRQLEEGQPDEERQLDEELQVDKNRQLGRDRQLDDAPWPVGAPQAAFVEADSEGRCDPEARPEGDFFQQAFREVHKTSGQGSPPKGIHARNEAFDASEMELCWNPTPEGGVEEAGPSPSVFDPEWGQYDTAADLKSGENTATASNVSLLQSTANNASSATNLALVSAAETTSEASRLPPEPAGVYHAAAADEPKDDGSQAVFWESLRAEARRVSDYLGESGDGDEGDSEGFVAPVPGAQEGLEYFADEDAQLWGGVRADVQVGELAYTGMWEDWTGDSPEADLALTWPGGVKTAPQEQPDSIRREVTSDDEVAFGESRSKPLSSTVDEASQPVDWSTDLDNHNNDYINCSDNDKWISHDKNSNNSTQSDCEEACNHESESAASVPGEAGQAASACVIPQADSVPADMEFAQGFHSLNEVDTNEAWASFEDPAPELAGGVGVPQTLDAESGAAMQEAGAGNTGTRDDSGEVEPLGEGRRAMSASDCPLSDQGAESLPEQEPAQSKPQSSIARLKAAFELRSNSGVPVPVPKQSRYTSPSAGAGGTGDVAEANDVSSTVPGWRKPGRWRESKEHARPSADPSVFRERLSDELREDQTAVVERESASEAGAVTEAATEAVKGGDMGDVTEVVTEAATGAVTEAVTEAVKEGAGRVSLDAPAECDDCGVDCGGAPNDLVWHSNPLKAIFDLQFSVCENAASQPSVAETSGSEYGDSYVKSLEAQIQRERAEHAAEKAQLREQLAKAQEKSVVASLREELRKLNAELDSARNQPPQKPKESPREFLVSSLREEVRKLNAELDSARNQTPQKPERMRSDPQNTLIASLQEELFQLRVELCKSSSRPPTAPTTTLSDASTPRRRSAKDLNVIAEGSADSQATNNENGILASPGATQTPANTPCVTSENLMAVESPQFIAMERELQMFKAAHKSAEARGAEQLKAQQEAHEAEVYDLMAQLELRNKVHEDQMCKIMEGMNDLIMRSDPLGFMPKISAEQYKRYFQLQW